MATFCFLITKHGIQRQNQALRELGVRCRSSQKRGAKFSKFIAEIYAFLAHFGRPGDSLFTSQTMTSAVMQGNQPQQISLQFVQRVRFGGGDQNLMTADVVIHYCTKAEITCLANGGK